MSMEITPSKKIITLEAQITRCGCGLRVYEKDHKCPKPIIEAVQMLGKYEQNEQGEMVAVPVYGPDGKPIWVEKKEDL